MSSGGQFPVSPDNRRRNVIERCVGWLKEARAVATRYEKLAVHYLGILKLAMIRRYLRLASANTA
jgi:transposase